jgi:hypothetical protein
VGGHTLVCSQGGGVCTILCSGYDECEGWLHSWSVPGVGVLDI